MFKIELGNCDFRKSLYPYIVDAQKWAASVRWHYTVDAEKSISYIQGCRKLVNSGAT